MRSPGFRSNRTDVATNTGSLRGTHRRPTHAPQQQITGWVSRTARLRAPATAAYERGSLGRAVEAPPLTWRSAPEPREPPRRYLTYVLPKQADRSAGKGTTRLTEVRQWRIFSM
jgi:hypothetical protein